MPLERRALYQAVAVAAGTLLAGSLLVDRLERLELAERRRAAAELARGPAFALEQEVARSLDSVMVLGALVSERASARELGAVAERLLALHGTTAHLQLAEGGVINHLWPLAGNERARGLDLLRHPVHGPWIRRVLETRRPQLYGPFELVQGGQGLALRAPVFVRDGGAERAWGISSAIIRLPVLLEAGRLSRLGAAGLRWELRHAAGEGRGLLAASDPEAAPLADPEEVEVHLIDQTWRLGVAPAAGWGAHEQAPLHLAVVALGLLAGLLAYRTLAQPAVLRREVAARTAELAEAHREQQAALEARRQSQKLEAVGLLAGGVAHDFNNLLAAILGHADVLALEAAPGSEVEASARTISQAAQRAGELTRQLLAFARLGQHRQEPVDLHALVAEATGLLGRTLGKSIRIVTALAAPRHHVRGDPGQLQQVIVNLAVNARDAMPEGGTLTLATSERRGGPGGPAGGPPPGAWLVLEVTDTGTGIAPADLERIFEPFFTTKAEGRGSGLGLATVYGIVKAHGGEIRAEPRDGGGTRFTVSLPLLEAPPPAAPPPEPPPRHGSGVVLVVDDEDLVRRAAGRMLAALGYHPALVAGGEEALAWLASQAAPPRAVLLDLAMPGMDGAAAFRLMRQRWPALPVILCSGFARNAQAQQLLDEGALGFLQKPYRTAELGEALAALGLAGTAGPPATAPGGGGAPTP